MKKISSESLLGIAQSEIRELLLECKKLQNLHPVDLQKTTGPGKWSIAQVLEHLNIYARFYIAAIEKQLDHHQTSAKEFFKPGWLGNYFTNLMKPDEQNKIRKKMKSPANAIPSAQPDVEKELNEFINHQHHLLNLLQIAGSANLESIRVPISLTKLIKLKLGDTFRFVIGHEQRHFVQIANLLSANSNERNRQAARPESGKLSNETATLLFVLAFMKKDFIKS